MTMQEAIQGRWCCIEGVLKCYPHETLETIIDRIAEAEVLEQIVAMLHDIERIFRISSLNFRFCGNCIFLWHRS